MNLPTLPPKDSVAFLIITVAITALITLIIQKYLGKILKFLLFPFHKIGQIIYGWISPLNFLNISLRNYKKHILRSDLVTIESPVGPSDLTIPLEHSFAPLRLFKMKSDDTLELFDYAQSTKRFIVLGGPGTGKTTLMKNLLFNIIKRKTHSKELNRLIPVFISLRTIAKKQCDVKQAIIDAFAHFHFPGAEKFIDLNTNKGNMLVILDGLDEVGVNRNFVSSKIREFCHTDDQNEYKNSIIVTCREHSYTIEDLRDVIPAVVKIESFTARHIKTFLRGWPQHKGRTAITLSPTIQNDQILREICSNPLMLTILAGLYLDDDQFSIPRSRKEFYEACIDELMIKRPVRRETDLKFRHEDKIKIWGYALDSTDHNI